ncbi:unnamed protein product [Camellia sinensis]
MSRLSDHEVHERYNQECCCLFNMFDNRKIDAKKLDATLKSLAKKYYYSGTGCCRFIHCANSLSQPSSKVPHEKGIGGFANVSGYATGSTNAPHEGDLEMERANNNGDPSALGNVSLLVVPRVAHTADRLGEYGVNVARTVFRVFVAAASCTTKSNLAKASYAIGLANSRAANLLAGTHWKATTPILAKAGIVAYAVGVLTDMGKDLPPPLLLGAMTAAVFIIIAAMVFAERLA